MKNKMVLAVWYEPDHVKYAVYTSDHNLERKSPHIMDQRLLVPGAFCYPPRNCVCFLDVLRTAREMPVWRAWSSPSRQPAGDP